MEQLVPGLWHWRAAHPEWEPGESWPQLVSCYAWDSGGELTLFDPLAVPDSLVDLIGERDSRIVLTVPWHERDTKSLVERFALPVIAPHPDSEDDLMAKFAVSRDRAAGGSPDLAWLTRSVTFYGAGDDLGRGMRAYPGSEHNDLLVWLEEPRALIVGDPIVDLGDGLEVWAESIGHRKPREAVAADLMALLDLPVEHVLPTHGSPTTRAELERALAPDGTPRGA